ncbi:hypothetical protein L204_104397 [Cryptococcus depauperatus]
MLACLEHGTLHRAPRNLKAVTLANLQEIKLERNNTRSHTGLLWYKYFPTALIEAEEDQ